MAINNTKAPVTNEAFFILSYGRSGSTLLRYIVDTHPKIACPAEIDLGILADSLFHTVYYTIGQSSIKTEKTDQEQVSLDKTREIITSLMNEYTQGKGKEIWCERSPYTVDHLAMIDRLFPSSKHICLHRNCLDFAHSFLSINRYNAGTVMAAYVHRNPSSILSAVIDYWLDKTELLLEFESARSSRCIRMKYEDLVVNPTQVIDSIFSFLTIEWNENMLESVFTAQHDDGPGDAKLLYTNRIKSNTVGKGSVIPYDQIPKTFLSRINAVNEKLGYPSVETYYETCHRQAVVSNAKSVAASSVSKGDPTISALFEEKATLFATLDRTCKLLVTGKNGGIWLCGPQKPHIVQSSESGEEDTDCTIILSYQALMDIFNNEQNPMEAYAQGKIRIAGNLEVAEQFGRLLLGA